MSKQQYLVVCSTFDLATAATLASVTTTDANTIDSATIGPSTADIALFMIVVFVCVAVGLAGMLVFTRQPRCLRMRLHRARHRRRRRRHHRQQQTSARNRRERPPPYASQTLNVPREPPPAYTSQILDNSGQLGNNSDTPPSQPLALPAPADQLPSSDRDIQLSSLAAYAFGQPSGANSHSTDVDTVYVAHNVDSGAPASAPRLLTNVDEAINEATADTTSSNQAANIAPLPPTPVEPVDLPAIPSSPPPSYVSRLPSEAGGVIVRSDDIAINFPALPVTAGINRPGEPLDSELQLSDVTNIVIDTSALDNTGDGRNETQMNRPDANPTAQQVLTNVDCIPGSSRVTQNINRGVVVLPLSPSTEKPPLPDDQVDPATPL